MTYDLVLTTIGEEMSQSQTKKKKKGKGKPKRKNQPTTNVKLNKTYTDPKTGKKYTVT